MSIFDPKKLTPHKIERGQVAGNHYNDMPIDVIEFCHINGLGFNEGSVIKYICRYKKKNGIEDLKKARNFIDRIIKLEES